MTSGTRATAHPSKPVARTSTRRTCSVCSEKLSAYNPGPNCYAHTVGVPWKGPNNRP